MEETKEHKYIRENFRQLLKRYKGKYILVRGEDVDQVFDTPLDAYKYAKEHYPDGKYVIKEMTKDAMKPVKIPLRSQVYPQDS